MKAPAKTKKLFELLKSCADDMRTVTYGDAAPIVGLASYGMGRQLAFIRDNICRQRGYPWLNALAVNGKTRRPGDSFLPPGVAVGRDEEHLWRGMVLQVFAFDWSSITFAGDE